MNSFEKWSVWITSALTVATGLGYFVLEYLVASPDGYAVVNHPWQPYFLKAHVLVSPLLLFALGTIAVHHVWDHWVSGVRVSRRSAVLTTLAVLPMVLTGYLIQVLTDQGWISAMAVAHIVFGCLYGAGLVVHTWIIRRRNGASVRRRGEGREGPARGGGPDDAPALDGGDPGRRDAEASGAAEGAARPR